MTLIVTRISKYGIIHASDSNLTNKTRLERRGKKIFAVPYLNAALSFSGNYGVNKFYMHEWMNNFIYKQSLIKNITLEVFAKNLGTSLQREMLPIQKAEPNQIHLAGYVEENGNSHPEFWYIRNIKEINEFNGNYEDIRSEFAVDEQLWKDGIFVNALANGVHWFYFNGFPAGRASFLVAQEPLKKLLNEIWSNQNWEFRQPNSLGDEEAFLRLYIQLVNTLFVSSNYKIPYIGGKVQTYCIPSPTNIVIS